MSKTGTLIDQLLEIALESVKPKRIRLATHRWPDPDAFLCLWQAERLIFPETEIELVFVNAGETLPDTEDGVPTYHFDVGGGPSDQHGKHIVRTSSAALTAERFHLANVSGLQSLIDLSIASDNIDPLLPDSIHYAIKGYPYLPQFQRNGQINWQMVKERVFELFDMMFSKEKREVQNRIDLGKYAEWTMLPNGLTICNIMWRPQLRGEAFNKGADIVFWTIRKGEKGFYVALQLNRDLSNKLHLRGAAREIRKAEMENRGIRIENEESLSQTGEHPLLPGWFLLDNGALLACGTRKRDLKEGEFTTLKPRQILAIATSVLGRINSQSISRWRNGSS